MNPGATAAQTRWRVGGWLVGTGFLLPLTVMLLLGGSFVLLLFGIALASLGTLIANPFRTMGRLRVHGRMDPVVSLKPLGIFSYTLFFLVFVLPFAVGEWILRMLGEWFEGRDPAPDSIEEHAPHFDGPIVWPASTPARRGRWRR